MSTPRAPATRAGGLFNSPAGLWLVIVVYMLDTMGYFGSLFLMQGYLVKDVQFKDAGAGWIIAVFTGLVTIWMVVLGGVADRLGVRRGLLASLALAVVGRAIYASASLAGSAGPALAMAGLLIASIGAGMTTPLAYAGVKRFSSVEAGAIAYSVMYAGMNLGIVLIGALSQFVRTSVDQAAAGWAAQVAGLGLSGIGAVNWATTALAVVTLVWFALSMTRSVEARFVRQTEAPAAIGPIDPLAVRFRRYFTAGPLADIRFVFFIFALLPVRTLFAHQWLTLPEYVLRAFPAEVGRYMEWIVTWVNPAVIVIGAPLVAWMTARARTYDLMLIGALVSAVPTFLLCVGPNLWLLLTYLVIFSIGEAIWSPRFQQHVADLAPEGRVAQYMGVANIPWFLAKTTTGMYSGVLLGIYCPLEGEKNTEVLWLIYASIAMLSPILLLAGRAWATRPPTASPVDGASPARA